MAFISENYHKTYAPNTRETVRRQVLHQFVQARVADYNAFEPDLPTNSPRAHYAISEAALAAIQVYGSPSWEVAAEKFISEQGSLAATYARHRSTGTVVPVRLPNGEEIELSPGKHNAVQKAIVEHFAPRFAPAVELLNTGDTAKKKLIMDVGSLTDLGLSSSDHDKLPDVVLFERERRWLFLIEAVTSHGPMSPKANGFASLPPRAWSPISWNSARTDRCNAPINNWNVWTWSFSMNWATCRSPRR